MGRRDWLWVGLSAALLAGGSLGAFVAALALIEEPAARTVAFLTLSYGQLVFVLAMREGAEPVWRSEITRNPYVWAGIALSAGLATGAVFAPVVGDVLALVPPGAVGWGLIVAGTLAPLVLSEAIRAALHPHGRAGAALAD